MGKEKRRFWTRYDKVQQAEPTEKISNLEGNLYAVLFNANEGRHSIDIRKIYNSLINTGILDSNISVLEGDGKTQNRFVNKPATISSLESTIDSIRQEAKTNDRLLVYVTNHGGRTNGQNFVKTYNGSIFEKDFEQLTQDLPINLGLFYFAQCRSSGFAERMGQGKNIGMSNATKEERSHGFTWNGANFTSYLFPEILEKNMTVEKAFNQAAFRNLHTSLFYRETPQLRWQNADPSKLCLNPYLIRTKR